jgi:hypothetical protein
VFRLTVGKLAKDEDLSEEEKEKRRKEKEDRKKADEDRWDRFRQCERCGFCFCRYCQQTWWVLHRPRAMKAPVSKLTP